MDHSTYSCLQAKKEEKKPILIYNLWNPLVSINKLKDMYSMHSLQLCLHFE